MIVRLTRLLVRGAAAATLSVASMTAVFALTVVFPGRRLRPRRLAVRRAIYRGWARAMCAACGISVERRGTPPVGPVLLVANHLSYVDILVLATDYPARFVAKSEVRSWPLVGLMCRCVDTIFVDRSSKRDVVRVSERIAAALEEGDGVVLFPEGTSSRGREVTPFRTSLLAVAAERRLPVWCATLRFDTPPREPAPDLAVAWWGGMTFGPHALRLLQLRHIGATVQFADQQVSDGDRKVLGEKLRAVVAASFVPLRSDEPEPAALAANVTELIR